MWHNLPFGGAKRAMFGHVQALAERGHEIEIWQPPLPADDMLDLSRYAKIHVVPLPFRELGTRKGALDVLDYVTRLYRLVPQMVKHSEQCGAEISAGGFDVFYSNTDVYFHTPFIGRYVTGMPKGLYLHDPFRPLYEPMPKLPIVRLPKDVRFSLKPRAIKSRIRDLVDLRNARWQSREELDNAMSFDKIWVNSLYSRESTYRAFALDSTVCYLGIDTEHFEYRHQPRERFVFGLGTICAQKNPLLVIEAVATMPDPKPPIVWCHNITDPIYYPAVVARAKELGVEFRSQYMTPEDELVDLMNRAWVMAYASRLEPFGLAPLEAQSCGVPVVSIAEAGPRESILDGVTGYLVNPVPAEMGRALSRLFEDVELRDRLGDQAAANVRERWSNAAATDRIEAALLDLAVDNNL